MRYELKYTFDKGMYDSLIKSIMNSNYLFKEIFHERQVNNIYYDTASFHDYHANLRGDTNRSKTRIRWYDSLTGEVEKPTLEIKYKKGMVGSKKSIILPSFGFNKDFSYNEYARSLRGTLFEKDEKYDAVIGEFLSKKPALVNCYIRRYFATPDNKYRITIDKDMMFYHYMHALKDNKFGIKDERIVLEVKYTVENSHNVSDLLNGLGYRVGKNSKYVNGINAAYFNILPY